MATRQQFVQLKDQADREKWSGVKFARKLGIPVVDSRTDFNFTVTGADALVGTEGSTVNCPFAKGGEHKRGVIGLVVSTCVAYVFYKDRALRYNVPTLERYSVVVTDATGAHIKPGPYRFLARTPSQAPGYRRKKAAAKKAAGRRRKTTAPKNKGKGNKSGGKRRSASASLGVRRISH